MIGRIRTYKPEIFKDEELWDLKVKTGFDILQAFEGLWSYSDREGRFEWRPRALKADILPFWDGDFEDILNALWNAGFIMRYAVDGKVYGIVKNLKKHQRFNSREPESDLPAPVGACVHAQSEAPLMHAQEEGKGREQEGKGTDTSTSSPVRAVFEHWKATLKHPNAKLDPKRERAIRQQLKQFSTEQLCRAIDGCAKSDFHMGRDKNSSGVHDDITLICRDASHVEKFIAMASGEIRSSAGPPPPDPVQTWKADARVRFLIEQHGGKFDQMLPAFFASGRHRECKTHQELDRALAGFAKERLKPTAEAAQ